MRKFLSLLALLAIAASPLAYSQAVSPTPAASATPKKRSHKAASPAPSPAAPVTNATPEASATPKKRSKKEATAAASPANTPALASTPVPPAAPSPTATGGVLGLFHKKNASPTPAAAANQPQAPANTGAPGNGQVWVNTESHVYHKAGSRFYGKTKQGKYMSEADAIKEGDHAAKNE
jgi:hypothetical protein